jgi:hypothetical protein
MRVLVYLAIQLAIYLPLATVGFLAHLQRFRREIESRRVSVARVASGFSIFWGSLGAAGVAAEAILTAAGW